MSYIALYRKYRPLTFDDMIGQKSVTRILKNQIKSGKISHAYLFSGTRGTGKTSAAKIFSRAINCLDPHDGEPCNECAVCKSILENNTADVIEMDAASNNSVENIRQIRQEVVYATIDVKYRVYIIDEVHMLTPSAFNALLKTLEEPPANVVFILATTEQHKIPVTILSRCLKFDFNRLSEEEIATRIRYVLEQENIPYEEEACRYIAKLADGAVRDALSILDRCISENKDALKYEEVLKIVGAIDSKVIEDIVESILNYKTNEALNHIDVLLEKGKDLRKLCSQLTEAFLNRLLVDENNKERLIDIINRLSKLDSDLRMTSNPSILLKATIVGLCSISVDNTQLSDSSLQEIIKKIENLEEEIKKLKEAPPKKTTVLSQEVKQAEKVSLTNIEEMPITEFKEIEELKKNIIEQGKLKVYSALAGASIYISDNQTILITQNEFAYKLLKMEESIQVISNTLKEKYQIMNPLLIELQKKDETKVSKLESLLKENQINYTSID